MKRFFLVVLTVGLMVPAEAYAQEVYKNASNQVILDLTVGAGMPAGARTSVSKTEIYKNFTPQESVLGTDNKHSESINREVFQKLEVAKYDLTGNGTIGSSGGTFTWVSAFNYCMAMGTGWRLPTQRELMLIYIFRPALRDLFGGETFSSVDYWSSTEYTSTWSWGVDFTDGGTSGLKDKTYSNRARCVREVTP